MSEIKYSEKLEKEARRQESDHKAWNLHFKAKKEKRKEDFLDNEFKQLCKKYKCTYLHPGEVCEISGTEFGFIDFWPKSNTVRIRRKNKYIKSNALQWIRKHLL